ncbi:MAG: dihydrofolate reductase [Bacteroidales bacterium]|nr:dihydrofolate reductase [Bacteroidales bacterium]
MKLNHIIMASAAMLATACNTPKEPSQNEQPWSLDRFADIEVLRYEVPGFEQLSLQQKQLIFHLTEAAQWGRDILWDQNGKNNLAIREICETLYTQYNGDKTTDDWKAFEQYMKQIWFANGIHHHYSNAKFKPGFSQNWMEEAISSLSEEAQKDIATIGLAYPEAERAMFDPDFLSIKVNQADGEDAVATSAVNFYEGVTQAEVEAFYNKLKDPKDATPVMYGLNSKLVKEDGKLVEKVWKVGGMYSKTIEKIVENLNKALAFAENETQKSVIEKLIKYYTSGDLKDFDDYSIAWVNDLDSKVDFVNGFIESYNDPLGMRGSWESLVNFKDSANTARTEVVSRNAQWFEDHSPIDDRFRKKEVKGVTAKVITVAMLAGDSYPATPIGINLPNSNWIRAQHGSKSVSIDNITAAYDAAASGSGFNEEFMWSDAERELSKKYGHYTGNVHTDLHECLGHGSGQLLPGVDPDALKTHGSTLEEARADIFALYYMADPKLVELGVMPDMEAYKSAYYQQMMNGLMTQLVRILPGDNIEEAHMRNRALIAYWTLDRAQQDANGSKPALCFEQREGKTYVVVNDYEKLHTYFGELLGELQRIKSEGDYEAGRALVEKYAVKVDPTLHAEVLERYQKLNLAPYKGFVNPRYELVKNDTGEVTDVRVIYGSESYAEQMLRYSKNYSVK